MLSRIVKSHSLIRKYSSSPIKLGETFGELENSSSSIIDSITTGKLNKSTTNTNTGKPEENNSKSLYKSFFEDFEKLKKDSQSNNTRITSFEEQKSFKQVFDYLSKETNKVGVVKSLETFVNFQSPIQKRQNINNSNEIDTNDPKISNRLSFFIKDSGPINLETQYKMHSLSKQTYIEALAPTLTYINKNINTSTEFYKFIKSNIIEEFLKKSSTNIKKKSYKMEDIKKQSENSPLNPIVNRKTLPVLLNYCLNSLTFDFDAFQSSQLLVNYIKKHESIELYGFGLNIDVYNSIFIQTWSKTGNLSLISDLIDELKINAIQPNLYTFKILAKIYLYCMRLQDSKLSEPYIIWNEASSVHKLRDYLQDFRLL